jgi:hypothetical protein
MDIYEITQLQPKIETLLLESRLLGESTYSEGVYSGEC